MLQNDNVASQIKFGVDADYYHSNTTFFSISSIVVKRGNGLNFKQKHLY